MALSDGEYLEPQEADSHGGDADDGAGEEEEDKEEEEDVVDWEDGGGFDEDPVYGVEDLDVAEDVAAVGLADGVFGFIDAGEEHGDPDDDGDN